MNSSNRLAIVLGSLIVVLLAIGGLVLARGPAEPGTTPADVATDDETDVAGEATPTPEPTATEPDEVEEPSPSPSPEEVGEDATNGSADGAGVAGDDAGDGDEPEDGDNGEPADGDDGEPADDDDRRDVASDLEDDTRDADASGDLPESGGGAVVTGLLLLGAGLAVRPRRR